MRKLSHDEIAKNRSTLETIHKVEKLPVYVILDSIRSNYNVGSIFRTSDGVMIEKLYLCGYTPFPPSSKMEGGKKEILKTALGSTESIKWEYVKNAKDIIKKLKDKGINIFALELTDSSIPYYNLNSLRFPIGLIIGNEITGVSQELIDMCDGALEIPQYGIKQSLNVAVAYGITIFELRKKYEKSKNYY